MHDTVSTLTRAEVRDITGGCAQRERQIRHLQAMGIPFQVRADGWPAVDRRAYYQAMGCRAANDERPEGAVLNLEGIEG